MRFPLMAVAVVTCLLVSCGTTNDATIDGTVSRSIGPPDASTPSVSVIDESTSDDDVTRPDLRRGDEGPWVVTLQQELTRHGYPLEDDGIFGSVTEAAVREFQSAKGLTVDGIVGASTWAALAEPESPNTTVWPPATMSTPSPTPTTGTTTAGIQPAQGSLAALLVPIAERENVEPIDECYDSWVEPGQDLAELVQLDPSSTVSGGLVVWCRLRSSVGDPGDLLLVAFDAKAAVFGTSSLFAQLPFTWPPGLSCSEIAERMGGITPDAQPLRLAGKYFDTLAYWFLDGQPPELDPDGDGRPCEDTYPPEAVDAVWSGGFVSPYS